MDNIEEFINKAPNEYSKCIAKVAKESMRLLDLHNKPLKNGYYPESGNAHNIVCQADDNISAGGITGAMSEYVAQLVKQCHSRGEEFYKSYHNKLSVIA
jgi:hypothetical protein